MAEMENAIFTNMCMVYDGAGNILVQNRRNLNWPGITFPGGHVEHGESFSGSVIREVKEETGLDIKNPKLCGIKWWSVGANKRYIVLLFKANEYSGTLKSSKEGKIFWASLDEIPKMKLAPSFDKMLEVFINDDICEYASVKVNDEWVDIFK